jgi:FlaA1/EpsC-like NDP-sugar epimerase
LKLEVPSRFKIVAFVDKNNQNSSKRMLDLPILTQRKKITHLDAIYGAEGGLRGQKFIKKERLLIVDQCLEFNYKVYIVPLITDWENQKEIFRK